VETKNRRLNKARETLRNEKDRLETMIKANREAAVCLPKLESFVKLIQNKISALDYDSKRQVLDMLDIKVWPDGLNVIITGVLDKRCVVTADMHPQ